VNQPDLTLDTLTLGPDGITCHYRPRTPYWPTTPLTLEQMAGALRLAEQQDEAVLAIFRALDSRLAPSAVHRIGVANGRQWLLTSVRRSMTNLANAGPLVRLTDTRMGPYGRPEHLWALAGSQAIAPHPKPDGVTVEAA
jgi:hypothetical protein